MDATAPDPIVRIGHLANAIAGRATYASGQNGPVVTSPE